MTAALPLAERVRALVRSGARSAQIRDRLQIEGYQPRDLRNLKVVISQARAKVGAPKLATGAGPQVAMRTRAYFEAQSRGLGANHLMALVLEQIADDDLLDAILDGDGI